MRARERKRGEGERNEVRETEQDWRGREGEEVLCEDILSRVVFVERQVLTTLPLAQEDWPTGYATEEIVFITSRWRTA